MNCREIPIGRSGTGTLRAGGQRADQLGGAIVGSGTSAQKPGRTLRLWVIKSMTNGGGAKTLHPQTRATDILFAVDLQQVAWQSTSSPSLSHLFALARFPSCASRGPKAGAITTGDWTSALASSTFPASF